LGRQRMLGVGDRIQDLVVHADLFHRTACRLRMVGSYERNRLSLVTHPLAREYRLVVMFEPVGVLTGNVLVGEYRVHPRGTDRLGDVDPADPRRRVRAPQCRPPDDGLAPQIGGVGELTAPLDRAVRTSQAAAGPLSGGYGRRR